MLIDMRVCVRRTQSGEAVVMKEFKALKEEIAELKQLIRDMAAEKAKAQ